MKPPYWIGWAHTRRSYFLILSYGVPKPSAYRIISTFAAGSIACLFVIILYWNCSTD